MSTEPKDDYSEFTGEMARIISETYLRNIYHVQREDNFNITQREAQRDMDKAEITASLCIELMDALIIRRYDYILNNAIKKSLELKKGLDNE